MNFRWETSEDGRQKWLFCGRSPELAWLQKRTKFWSAVIWLPGCEPSKEFAPLEIQEADVVNRVREWIENLGVELGALRPKQASEVPDTDLQQPTVPSSSLGRQ